MFLGGVDRNANCFESKLKPQRQKTKKAYEYEEIPNKEQIAPSTVDRTRIKNFLNTDDSSQKSLTTNRQVVNKIAENVIRYKVSPTAGAAIATATLESFGLISIENTKNIIDRSKLKRAIQKVGSTVDLKIPTKISGLYFDGRKDKTKIYADRRIKTVVEEHVCLIIEPRSIFLGHTTPESGTAKDILKSFQSFFEEKKISSDSLVAVGCDGTNTNVGIKGGVIKLLEKYLNRPLHWFICQLHGNELPLRHLIAYLGFETSGPLGFTGEFGKALNSCTSLPVQQFNQIDGDIPIILQSDLSTDQQYLLDICHAIQNGYCSENLAKREPGKIVLN